MLCRLLSLMHFLQARIALRMPWWSLATGFQTVCEIAGVSGNAASVRQQMDESNVKSTLPPGVDVGTKTDAQVPLPTAAQAPLLFRTYSNLCFNSPKAVYMCSNLLHARHVLPNVQIAASEADHIMNAVAAGEAAWDDVRVELSEQYKRAGASSNAALVTAY